METNRYTAFSGTVLLKRGKVEDVVREVKQQLDQDRNQSIAIYDDATGYRIDFDFRGTVEDVLKRLPDHPLLAAQKPSQETTKSRGRPKLGVVAGEVTLLPRHWDWLKEQRGGASATLRKLVEQARKRSQSDAIAVKSRDALHRFMWDIAGNLDGFEEATRSFFAGEYNRFLEQIQNWPSDILDYVRERVSHIQDLEKIAAEVKKEQE